MPPCWAGRFSMGQQTSCRCHRREQTGRIHAHCTDLLNVLCAQRTSKRVDDFASGGNLVWPLRLVQRGVWRYTGFVYPIKSNAYETTTVLFNAAKSSQTSLKYKVIGRRPDGPRSCRDPAFPPPVGHSGVKPHRCARQAARTVTNALHPRRRRAARRVARGRRPLAGLQLDPRGPSRRFRIRWRGATSVACRRSDRRGG